jgi:SpoVK/Ycf46/Vps4 family AAA+-type ATPase
MNKARFLRLHDADDNSVIILAQTMITLCQAQMNEFGRKHTLIYINGEDINSITVNESPEKIYQLFEDNDIKYQFLKLHDADDNSVILLNQELVSLAKAQNDGNKKDTIIFINSDDINSITVNEASEKIYQMMNDNIQHGGAEKTQKTSKG